jgi:hypothetical protein
MQPEERVHSHQEFRGSIVSVRVVEDCIRKTGKYTKGIVMQSTEKIQGAAFASKVMRELYDVYPTLQTGLGLDTDFVVFVGWIFSEPTVPVLFKYDYRTGTASITIKGGLQDTDKLNKGIPGFREALLAVKEGVECPHFVTPSPVVTFPSTQMRQIAT